MFKHRTFPASITSSSGGSGRVTGAESPTGASAGASGTAVAGAGGQNVRATSGRSKTERKTLSPSMMLDRSFGSSGGLSHWMDAWPMPPQPRRFL